MVYDWARRDGVARNDRIKIDLRIRILRGWNRWRRCLAPDVIGKGRRVGIAIADWQQPEIIFDRPQQAIVRKPRRIAASRYHTTKQHRQHAVRSLVLATTLVPHDCEQRTLSMLSGASAGLNELPEPERRPFE